MADNAQLPADGLLVATDELATINGQAAPAGLQVQRAKVGFGAEDDFNDVTNSNPLPVALQGTTPISAASLPLPAGAATAAGQADIVAAINASGGGGGPVTVSNFPAMQPISAAALPLPSGAATDAGIAAVIIALGSPMQAGGAVSITGTAAVSVASLPLPSGAATAADIASVVTALGSPLQAGGTVALDAPTLAALESINAAISAPVALDSATLTALENINATVSGTVALDGPSLAALENTNVTLTGLTYPGSTNNSSTTPLAVGGSFVGVIETIQNQQAAQIEVVSNQPYRVTVNQYIDAGGTKRTSSDAFTRAANAPMSVNVTLPGNYFNVVVENLGNSPTSVFELNTTFGIMDSAPRSVGRKVQDDAMPVALSVEDSDALLQIVERLGVLQMARGSDGSLRVTILGGTVTTVTTVTTVSTLANQTSIGGYGANNQIPALMNAAAASNIDRMVG